MTTTIFKYPFVISDKVLILMPKNAEVLDVQMQNGTPCIWAMVDPDEPLKERYFIIVGTGHPLPDKRGAYIGTFQMHGGELVWHLYHESKANA